MEGFLSLIKKDLGRLEPASFLRQFFLPRGGAFPFVLLLRIVQCSRRHFLSKWTIGVLAYPIFRHMEFKYGIHANPNIEIGGGLCVVHGEGVHLNCASIGRNLTVYQGVTLGIHKGGKPVVEDGVTVYPNAIVVGGITLGAGCTIGALSYVSRDVAAGSTVIGAPAHEIKGV